MNYGTIGEYRWAECERGTAGIWLPDVVRALAPQLRGLRAVNVSWDSGLILPGDPEVDSRWAFLDGHAVSPPISDGLTATWPYSGEGFDEWYFFSEVPTSLTIQPWCNWEDARLAEHRALAFPGGVDLARQLSDYSPRAIIGEGQRMYVLSIHDDVVDGFRALLAV